MINLIKIYVGEILEVTDGEQYLVTELRKSRYYEIINLRTGYKFLGSYQDIKETFGLKKRIGKVGENILDGDDWLCHENRCYPKILAGGGCINCFYYRLGSSKKRYYEPGDKVWISREKRTDVIEKTKLFILYNNTPLPFNLSRYYEESIGIDIDYSIRFLCNNRWYRWDELSCVKRTNSVLNIEQLDYICSGLCLFGPYDISNNKCFKCETGKIQRLRK